MTTGEEPAPPGAAAGPTASSGPARPAPAPPGHTPEEAAGPTSPAPGQQRPPLRRGLNTPLAGVCLGLSRHLGLSVPVVRATMIAL
ncbi:MAG TPA: PspC domain-containing protein, partial [Candidatus Nesterenkonia stercoripullorum]|nr:PspC domain-containing protein [Candidatus Nesterenkonia stercoripullorum]